MRASLNLDEELVRAAREFSGIQEPTALVRHALRELISREVGRRLSALGGTMPNAEAGRRKRSARMR